MGDTSRGTTRLRSSAAARQSNASLSSTSTRGQPRGLPVLPQASHPPRAIGSIASTSSGAYAHTTAATMASSIATNASPFSEHSASAASLKSASIMSAAGAPGAGKRLSSIAPTAAAKPGGAAAAKAASLLASSGPPPAPKNENDTSGSLQSLMELRAKEERMSRISERDSRDPRLASAAPVPVIVDTQESAGPLLQKWRTQEAGIYNTLFRDSESQTEVLDFADYFEGTLGDVSRLADHFEKAENHPQHSAALMPLGAQQGRGGSEVLNSIPLIALKNLYAVSAWQQQEMQKQQQQNQQREVEMRQEEENLRVAMEHYAALQAQHAKERVAGAATAAAPTPSPPPAIPAESPHTQHRPSPLSHGQASLGSASWSPGRRSAATPGLATPVLESAQAEQMSRFVNAMVFASPDASSFQGDLETPLDSRLSTPRLSTMMGVGGRDPPPPFRQVGTGSSAVYSPVSGSAMSPTLSGVGDEFHSEAGDMYDLESSRFSGCPGSIPQMTVTRDRDSRSGYDTDDVTVVDIEERYKASRLMNTAQERINCMLKMVKSKQKQIVILKFMVTRTEDFLLAIQRREEAAIKKLRQQIEVLQKRIRQLGEDEEFAMADASERFIRVKASVHAGLLQQVDDGKQRLAEKVVEMRRMIDYQQKVTHDAQAMKREREALLTSRNNVAQYIVHVFEDAASIWAPAEGAVFPGTDKCQNAVSVMSGLLQNIGASLKFTELNGADGPSSQDVEYDLLAAKFSRLGKTLENAQYLTPMSLDAEAKKEPLMSYLYGRCIDSMKQIFIQMDHPKSSDISDIFNAVAFNENLDNACEISDSMRATSSDYLLEADSVSARSKFKGFLEKARAANVFKGGFLRFIAYFSELQAWLYKKYIPWVKEATAPRPETPPIPTSEAGCDPKDVFPDVDAIVANLKAGSTKPTKKAAGCQTDHVDVLTTPPPSEPSIYLMEDDDSYPDEIRNLAREKRLAVEAEDFNTAKLVKWQLDTLLGADSNWGTDGRGRSFLADGEVPGVSVSKASARSDAAAPTPGCADHLSPLGSQGGRKRNALRAVSMASSASSNMVLAAHFSQDQLDAYSPANLANLERILEPAYSTKGRAFTLAICSDMISSMDAKFIPGFDPDADAEVEEPPNAPQPPPSTSPPSEGQAEAPMEGSQQGVPRESPGSGTPVAEGCPGVLVDAEAEARRVWGDCQPPPVYEGGRVGCGGGEDAADPPEAVRTFRGAILKLSARNGWLKLRESLIRKSGQSLGLLCAMLPRGRGTVLWWTNAASYQSVLFSEMRILRRRREGIREKLGLYQSRAKKRSADITEWIDTATADAEKMGNRTLGKRLELVRDLLRALEPQAAEFDSMIAEIDAAEEANSASEAAFTRCAGVVRMAKAQQRDERKEEMYDLTLQKQRLQNIFRDRFVPKRDASQQTTEVMKTTVFCTDPSQQHRAAGESKPPFRGRVSSINPAARTSTASRRRSTRHSSVGIGVGGGGANSDPPPPCDSVAGESVGEPPCPRRWSGTSGKGRGAQRRTKKPARGRAQQQQRAAGGAPKNDPHPCPPEADGSGADASDGDGVAGSLQALPGGRQGGGGSSAAHGIQGVFLETLRADGQAEALQPPQHPSLLFVPNPPPAGGGGAAHARRGAPAAQHQQQRHPASQAAHGASGAAVRGCSPPTAVSRSEVNCSRMVSPRGYAADMPGGGGWLLPQQQQQHHQARHYCESCAALVADREARVSREKEFSWLPDTDRFCYEREDAIPCHVHGCFSNVLWVAQLKLELYSANGHFSEQNREKLMQALGALPSLPSRQKQEPTGQEQTQILGIPGVHPKTLPSGDADPALEEEEEGEGAGSAEGGEEEGGQAAGSCGSSTASTLVSAPRSPQGAG